MRILITGSSGFLGSHCFNFFKRCGFDVEGLDVVPSVTTTLVADVLQFMPKQHFDAVLHFAAEVKGRNNIEKNYLHMIKNVEIDRIVFEWAIRYAKHIIYPSSCAVYPVHLQEVRQVPLSENYINFKTLNIGVSDHLYGWSKLTAERVLWEISNNTNLHISILRPFSGYGPRQSLDYPVANLINMVKFNPDTLRVWGSGEQTRDFIHVNDIVDIINWCVLNPSPFRTLNAGTGRSMSFNELIDVMHLAVYGTLPKHIEKLLNRPVGMMHRVADITQQQALGLVPKITIEEGILTIL